MVSTRDGGIVAQCRPVKITIATNSATRPTMVSAQRFSMRLASASPSCGSAGTARAMTSPLVKNNAARKEGEEVEEEPHQEHECDSDAGDHQGATGAGAHDFIDALVFVARFFVDVGHGSSFSPAEPNAMR